MVQVNPKLLARPSSNGSSRTDASTTLTTLIRSSINSALAAMFSKPLSVRLENEKVLMQSLAQIDNGIKQFNNTKKDMQVGKAQLTTQKIDSFEVSNLESLTLQNVEKLAVAFEQLKPIITALQAGNKLDQQSVAFLRTMTSSLTGVNQSLQKLAVKDVKFPVEQIVDGLHSLEAAVHALKLEAPAQQDIKFPDFPKAISMMEGKAILSALKDVSAKIDALPKTPPELIVPKTVSVDNFPPQKYPLPPTNININPLRGFVQSTAVTVGTTPTPLPSTALAFRRSIVIYNNDSSNTLYIGGSNVTTAQGTPVPPLSYSPPFDAGVKMIIYGIVASNTINVRVLEGSNDTYTRGD